MKRTTQIRKRKVLHFKDRFHQLTKKSMLPFNVPFSCETRRSSWFLEYVVPWFSIFLSRFPKQIYIIGQQRRGITILSSSLPLSFTQNFNWAISTLVTKPTSKKSMVQNSAAEIRRHIDGMIKVQNLRQGIKSSVSEMCDGEDLWQWSCQTPFVCQPHHKNNSSSSLTSSNYVSLELLYNILHCLHPYQGFLNLMGKLNYSFISTFHRKIHL